MKYKTKSDKTIKRGSDAEKLVQSKLWKYGYNVERMPRSRSGQIYDLLVDSMYGVEVKSAMIIGKNKWVFFGKHLLGADLGFIHSFAFVFFYQDDSYKIRYIKAKDFLKRKVKKTYYTSFTPNDEELIKSPLKIFGKPKSKIKTKTIKQ